jgi:hypothetical protein
MDWIKFEVLIRVFSQIILVITKQYGKKGAMRFKGNDNIDVLNLAFVQPGVKYWTLDKKGVVPIIRSLDLGGYLF